MNDGKNDFSKFVKKVKIGDVCVDGMIDPGSFTCTVTASTVIEHNFKIEPCRSELVGWGDAENSIIPKAITYQNIKIDDCFAEKVCSRIMPDNVQQFPVLIGRNFTELPHIVYIKKDDKLIFIHKNDFEFENFPEIESNERKTITSVNNNILTRETMNFIDVRMDEKVFALPLKNKSDNSTKVDDRLIRKSILAINENVKILQPRKKPIAREDIICGKFLNESQISEIVNILNEYRMCVAFDESEIGCTNLIEMDIIEKPGSAPVRCKPYKANPQQRKIIREIVGKWKKDGIVTETKSPYASPVVLVKKKDGSWRLCIDFRRLNNNTVRMNYPIPSIEDGLQELRGAEWFIELDLFSGYLHMKLTPEPKAKTAFITPDETGQCERAMFGLMNAPFYFAELMRKVLGHDAKLAVHYFDNIYIYAKSWRELIEKFVKILKLLKNAGLTLNPKKLFRSRG